MASLLGQCEQADGLLGRANMLTIRLRGKGMMTQPQKICAKCFVFSALADDDGQRPSTMV
jgi:hypothetical protein